MRPLPWLRRALTVLCLLLCWALVGCAGLPQGVARPVSTSLAADAAAPLARAVADAGLAPGLSGFRALPQADHAFDARLTLIRRATVSLDLQYYQLGHDATGLAVLAALREAARRGVRVRLLLDDLYTRGLDDLLLGLAAEPGIELRLFNPFVQGRGAGLGRLLSFAGDFKRLNHRMHNKLFIADGVLAVAGGRNLADEYFGRAAEANFIDMDMLMAGAIVPELAALFDRYWNSELAWPVQAMADNGLDAAQRREAFERRIVDLGAPPAPMPRDLLGAAPLGEQLDSGLQLIGAHATAYADEPDKAGGGPRGDAPTLMTRLVDGLQRAQHEVLLFSPYFIPGERGLKHIQALRERGIAATIVTNSQASSDEPLVSVAYARYRAALLQAGVRLYELSPAGLQRDARAHRALGSSRGRLHAKLGLVDRHIVLVGSMNMDPRSAQVNTELGIAIDSPVLAQQLASVFDIAQTPGLYELRLAPDGRQVQWFGRGPDGAQPLDSEPESSPWQRLRLFLLSHFVPEALL